ncbi:MAG: cobalamin B12-binding domain-containing protein, partial [Blastocatellia bacterium]
GFEVIFTNFLLAGEVVNTAVQEDVAVIGVSISSGGHMAVFEDLMEGLRSAQADDVLVIGGGVIPNVDARELEQWGVRKVFGPGSSAEQVVTFIQENAIIFVKGE